MSGVEASIVIPLHNQAGFTKACLEYVRVNTSDVQAEIVLVDNASTDGTRELLDGLEGRHKVIRNEANLGFAKACNQGARAASSGRIVFLNNDTVPHRGWLRKLLSALERPEVGIAGPKLIYPDMTIQQAGVVFNEKGMPYHLYTGCPADLPGADKPRFFRAVTGACLAISKSDFWAAGGFDERYVNGMEDMALCMRIRALGKGILYEPSSVVTHFESRTESRHNHMNDNIRLFTREWSVNLTRDDVKYLAADGMGIWKPDAETLRFDTLENIRRRMAGELEAADRLLQSGNLPGAMAAYKQLFDIYLHNPMILERLAGLCDRLGHKELREGFNRKIEFATVASKGFRESFEPFMT